MVAPAYHAGLVRYTEAVGAVVAPEGFRADVPARGTFRPLQVAVCEELPCVAVVYLVFVGERQVRSVAVQQSRAQREAAAAPLGIRIQGEAHAGKRQDYRLFHRHSSSSKSALNESADSTSS